MMATAAAEQHTKEFKTNVMNNDDDNIVDAEITATTALAAATSKATNIASLLSTTSASIEKSLATMELQYFKAVSLYRRRNYEKCVEVCNAMLQAGHENNVQMFNTPPDEEENGSGGGGGGGGGSSGAEDMLLADFKNNGSGGGGVSGNIVSNNSSIQRYSSNLQRMAARQGGRQRGIYGNNVSSSSSASLAATTTSTSGGAAAASTSSGGFSGSSFSIMPTWMMEGVWQLKMRALTQRIYIDDLETNDADDAGK